MLALSALCMLLGLAALALAMDRHAAHLPVAGSGLKARRWLQVLGAAGLVASLVCILAVMDSGLAWITWLGLLAPATLCIALAMGWAVRGTKARKR
ncbi:DUF3325 family protein [Comamonas piscis]|uniref:DUF3325 family protein n=1 Tax=Comamonas piscis TaxID=1562974 RepID=A0A7G5ED17_9BURK|nr:DUF3325 family protein [Comamonas piscis]QMV71892.1 DUF3325 family protein [Comamonas piscis]WSO34629.1 DUF3325 family protein [Comamonas piscis]